MAPSPCIELTTAEQQLLLSVARRSIEAGLQGREPGAADADGLTPALREARAAFVTLTLHSALRGCVGTLHPDSPLYEAVANAAHSAAFRDPRYPALRAEELAETVIEVSVLSPLQELQAANREQLVAALRPGIDGVLLEQGRHRATFLPKVWDKLPDSEEFVDELLLKAGLQRGHWSAGLRCQRYQALTFAEPADGGVDHSTMR